MDLARERPALPIALALGTGTALAWGLLLAGTIEPASPIAFLAGWLLMMAAMMLPSAAPMIVLFAGLAPGPRLRANLACAAFVAGYALVWGAVGVGVLLAGWLVTAAVPESVLGGAVALVLIIAGLYQLSALKDACLRACRSPLDFLVMRWRPGLAGALRLGIEHGVYCLGCCAGLMAVLVGAGAMGLVWVFAIAAVIFVEKLLRGGILVGRAVGVALVGFGLAVALRPELAALIAGTR